MISQISKTFTPFNQSPKVAEEKGKKLPSVQEEKDFSEEFAYNEAQMNNINSADAMLMAAVDQGKMDSKIVDEWMSKLSANKGENKIEYPDFGTKEVDPKEYIKNLVSKITEEKPEDVEKITKNILKSGEFSSFSAEKLLEQQKEKNNSSLGEQIKQDLVKETVKLKLLDEGAEAKARLLKNSPGMVMGTGQIVDPQNGVATLNAKFGQAVNSDFNPPINNELLSIDKNLINNDNFEKIQNNKSLDDSDLIKLLKNVEGKYHNPDIDELSRVKIQEFNKETAQEPSRINELVSGRDFMIMRSGIKAQTVPPPVQNQGLKTDMLTAPEKPALAQLQEVGVEVNKIPEVKEQKIINKNLGESWKMAQVEAKHALDSQSSAVQTQKMDANVVPGAMTKEGFSSATVLNLTKGIQTMKDNGGGEIQLRLKPDHLGDVNVRVITKGDEVSLKIQASDAQAKEIFRESMPRLREALANQNLSLEKIEITIAPRSTSSGFMDSSMNNNQGRHGDSSGMLNNAFNNESNNRQNSFSQAMNENRELNNMQPLRRANSKISQKNSGVYSKSGRLDVIA